MVIKFLLRLFEIDCVTIEEEIKCHKKIIFETFPSTSDNN